MQILLRIDKTEVLREVAQTTSYTGAKKAGDDGAYERIATVDEDEAELERFWNESRAEVAHTFIRLMKEERMNDDAYELELNVSEMFDEALLESMQQGLFSYFVHNIVGKWYVFTNKEEAGVFSARGAELLEEVKEKAFFKKKPTRPTYNNE